MIATMFKWMTLQNSNNWASCRAVVGFLKVVRPLNANAEGTSGRKAREGVRPLSFFFFFFLGGGLGDLPHENFVIKDD